MSPLQSSHDIKEEHQAESFWAGTQTRADTSHLWEARAGCGLLKFSCLQWKIQILIELFKKKKSSCIYIYICRIYIYIKRLWYLTVGTTPPPCGISHNNSQEISACDGGWWHWSCDPLQESWRKLRGRRGGCERWHKDLNNQNKKQHLSDYCWVEEMLHNILSMRGRRPVLLHHRLLVFF